MNGKPIVSMTVLSAFLNDSLDLDITKFLAFVELMQRFQRVIRHSSVPGRDHYENDVEHSYQLAVIALYLVSAYPEEFEAYDRFKLVIYALFHDFVEVHAGDPFWGDGTPKSEKEAREAEALKLIRDEFPEFPELAAWIEEYESLENEEAWFINQLDKVLAVVVIYQSEGKSWQELGQTHEAIAETLLSKMKDRPPAPILQQLLVEVIRLFETRPDLFAAPPETPPVS